MKRFFPIIIKNNIQESKISNHSLRVATVSSLTKSEVAELTQKISSEIFAGKPSIHHRNN